MPLSVGTRVGPYEILGLIGAGGMGEVYRAHDGRLRRDVAIKILPQALVADSECHARFTREAQVLASLNHPHIAAIYGVEEVPTSTLALAAGATLPSTEAGRHVLALVLELVVGPTLADRIAQGPIPIDEALLVARQIADALEAAHGQGIVHRDLKPANIKLRPDGTVKVLDFGLAKAVEASLAIEGSGDLSSQCPTITSPAIATGAGMILGTAAYMSPEQARGKAVDKRSDVWSFGCVLYEMLTGRRAFGGDTLSDVLARVLELRPASATGSFRPRGQRTASGSHSRETASALLAISRCSLPTASARRCRLLRIPLPRRGHVLSEGPACGLCVRCRGT